jgi:hypothetical protein
MELVYLRVGPRVVSGEEEETNDESENKFARAAEDTQKLERDAVECRMAACPTTSLPKKGVEAGSVIFREQPARMRQEEEVVLLELIEIDAFLLERKAASEDDDDDDILITPARTGHKSFLQQQRQESIADDDNKCSNSLPTNATIAKTTKLQLSTPLGFVRLPIAVLTKKAQGGQNYCLVRSVRKANRLTPKHPVCLSISERKKA